VFNGLRLQTTCAIVAIFRTKSVILRDGPG
jgi:hypothetical protein